MLIGSEMYCIILRARSVVNSSSGGSRGFKYLFPNRRNGGLGLEVHQNNPFNTTDTPILTTVAIKSGPRDVASLMRPIPISILKPCRHTRQISRGKPNHTHSKPVPLHSSLFLGNMNCQQFPLPMLGEVPYQP